MHYVVPKIVQSGKTAGTVTPPFDLLVILLGSPPQVRSPLISTGVIIHTVKGGNEIVFQQERKFPQAAYPEDMYVAGISVF